MSTTCAVATVLLYCDAEDEPLDDVAAFNQLQHLRDLLDKTANDCVYRTNKLDVLLGTDVLDHTVHTTLSCP